MTQSGITACSTILAALALAGCGGGGGSGGGEGLEITIINKSSDAYLTRVEYLDVATEFAVAGADFFIAPGEAWSGILPLEPGTYWEVLHGERLGSGAPCTLDRRAMAARFPGNDQHWQTVIEPDVVQIVIEFEGLFCQGF